MSLAEFLVLVAVFLIGLGVGWTRGYVVGRWREAAERADPRSIHPVTEQRAPRSRRRRESLHRWWEFQRSRGR